MFIIMLKFIAIAGLMLAPFASAGFISSDMLLSADQPAAVPADGSVVMDAKINFSWGFGAIFPMPLTIYLEPEDVPEWLSVSVSPQSFTITPAGLRGGAIEKDVTIRLTSKEETDAFVLYSFTLHAYTNGSFLIKGAEDKKSVNVMQDFYDKGIRIDSPKKIRISNGGSKTIYVNITNNCNAPVTICFQQENETNMFEFSYENGTIIPSKVQKSLPITINAKKVGTQEMPFRIIYYPTGYEDKKNSVSTTITIESYGTGSSFVALEIAIFVIIVASILIFVWKRMK